MTCDEQLNKWLAGNSVHNNDGCDECCPDFSCCRPELLAPLEEREHFVVSNDLERQRMLMMFLGRLISTSPNKVHITGPDREAEDE